jgi:hypothetical protein
MTKSRKTATATRPVAIASAPAPMTIEQIHAETAAQLAADRATLDRLADTMRAAIPGPGSHHHEPKPHSALCLTCGAAFDLAGGFCVEERPERVEIPYETALELNTLANDISLEPNEVAARLISVGLFVLGRGGYRERFDLDDLWRAIDEKPRETAAAGA